jgi:hypothetical protein
MGGAFVFVGTVAQLVRSPGVPAWNTVWGEDGQVYLTDVFAHPAWTTILRGYAGYVQVVPRLLTLPTRVIPASWIAPYFATVGAVVASLLGLVVVRSAKGWIDSEPLRWTLGAVTVLVPVGYIEVDANVVDLNWTLVPTAFWAIASRRRGRADLALRVVVVVVTAMSTTVAVTLVPWVIAVACVRRRRDDFVVGGAFLVALAVQGLLDRATPANPSHPFVVSAAAKELGVRVLGSLAFGERWLGHLWLQRPHRLVAGALVVVAAFVLLSRPWRQPRPRVGLAGAAAGTGLLIFATTARVRGTAAIGLTTTAHTFDVGGGRYAYAPVLLLFGAIVVLVDGSRRAWLRALLLGWVAFVIVTSMRLASPRGAGPSWSAELAKARAVCRAHPTATGVGLAVTPRPVSIAYLPCDHLR